MCCGQKRALLSASQAVVPRRTVRFAERPIDSAATRTAYVPPPMPDWRPNRVSPPASSPDAMPQNSAAATATDRSTVNLRYTEQASIQLRGLISGRMYRFSDSQPLQTVDVRDSVALLQTRFFRRA